MAQLRQIKKRMVAVGTIRRITKTMQMIATAKFQKALRRAVGTKPYTQKVRELVSELAATVGRCPPHSVVASRAFCTERFSCAMTAASASRAAAMRR